LEGKSSSSDKSRSDDADGQQRKQMRKPTLVSFVAQMDRESVLLLSPDLLGETDELLVSMLNMEKLLRVDAEKKNMQPKFQA